MNIGPLDKRCRVERPVSTPDPEYGTPVITWELVGVRWCGVQDVLPSRSESIKQGLGISTSQARVRMRYCSDIDSSMRLTIMRPTARVYSIIGGPAELGNKDGVEFMVERVSS